MDKKNIHSKKVSRLQEQFRNFKNSHETSSPIALHYRTGYSNTTRTKAYKQNCSTLDFGQLNEVIAIYPDKKIASVEPRVTMEALLKATLPYQLVPSVLPECRGITVGGAIMGGAGESSSHRWGCFNDICPSYEIMNGDGKLLRVSSQENSNIYYGVAGSYGSLGALVSANIQLLSAQDLVHLRYYFFSDPLKTLDWMQNLIHSSQAPDFIDGMIFSKNSSVVIEGSLQAEDSLLSQAPLFSLKSPFSEWFYQHVKAIADDVQSPTYVEKMSLEDYFFRYDLGGFWMASYLFHFPFLACFIKEGIWGFEKGNEEHFNEKDIHRFHRIRNPHVLGRALLRPFLNTKKLWALLHQAENWIQRRMIIQDFCIPESRAPEFCKRILDDPAIFPIWLCPIKGTRTPQIFAPHFLSPTQTDSHLINFGLYGIPSHSTSIGSITKKLEEFVSSLGGRKALYSHSYYTPNEFWQIYPFEQYQDLRNKTKAQGIWHEITDKVLSK